MQHLITQLTLLIQTLTTMASKPDFLETTPDDQLERTRGELPDSLAGLAGTLPGFLPPLDVVSKGLEGFVASLTAHTVHLLQAGREAVLRREAGLLTMERSHPPPEEDGRRRLDTGLENALLEVKWWYEGVMTKEKSWFMKVVECDRLFGDGGGFGPWERMGRWLEEARGYYWGLCEVVSGIGEGVKRVTGRVPLFRRESVRRGS
jgi:hypothetical protein